MPLSFGLTFGELKRFHDVQLVESTTIFVDPEPYSKLELWMYHIKKVPLIVVTYEQWLPFVKGQNLNYLMYDQGRG